MGSVPEGFQQGRHGVYVLIRHGGKVVQFLFNGFNFLFPVRQRFSAVGTQKEGRDGAGERSHESDAREHQEYSQKFA